MHHVLQNNNILLYSAEHCIEHRTADSWKHKRSKLWS